MKYGGVVFLIVVATLELASFLLLSFSFRSWTSWSDVHERQTAWIEHSLDSPEIGHQPAAEVEAKIGRYALHPYLGYVLDVSLRARDRRPPGREPLAQHGFQLNPDGLFHDQPPVIAITGGSVAFHTVIDGAATLRETLAQTFPEFEHAPLVNLTMAGYKQPQQLLIVNYLMALGARFDIVINIDGFNEVALTRRENIRNDVFPFFPRNWLFLAQRELEPEQRLTEGELAYLDSLRRRSAQTFSAAPYRYSLTAGLCWALLDRYLDRELTARQIALLQRREEDEKSFQVTGPAWNVEPGEATDRELALFWMRSSQLLHHLLEGSGARYYHILQPNQYVEGSKPMGAEEQARAYTSNPLYGADAGKAYAHLIALGKELAQRGVRFSDQTLLFSDIEEPLYVDPCCHLNERGSQMLARAIGEFVVEDLLHFGRPYDLSLTQADDRSR